MNHLHQANSNIKPLPKSLSSSIISQIKITTLWECVVELVSNSIDANASNISIVLDIRRLSVKVTDNGDGILPHDFQHIGKSCYTSKWATGTVSTLGFRGTALSSISSLSAFIITSRHKSYASTKALRISYGDEPNIYTPRESKYSHGTTVHITGLFLHTPVRQKSVLSTSDLAQIEKVKRAIFPLVITNPEITISIHDPENHSLLHIPGTTSVPLPRHVTALRATFGSHIANRWQTVHTTVKDVDVRGTIAFDPVRNGQIQHVIINSRRLETSPIYKRLNTIFSDLASTRLTSDSGLYMVYVFEVNYERTISDCACYSVLGEIELDRLAYIEKLLVAIAKKLLKAHGHTLNSPENKGGILKNTDTKKKQIPTDTLVYSSARTARSNENELRGRLITRKPNGTISLNCCTRNNQRMSIPHATPTELNTDTLKPLTPTLLPSIASKYFDRSPYDLGIDLTALEKQFTKSDLSSLKLISQIDNKFLLVKIVSSQPYKPLQSCLAVIDQHAADERIKLEHFFTEITTMSLHQTATPLEFPFKMTLSEQDYFFFQESSRLFRQFGIAYHMGPQNLLHATKKEKLFLLLTHIPELALRKVSPTTSRLEIEFVHKLLLGHAKDVMEKRASALPIDHSLHWSVSIRNYPVALIELFQSKACRTAIKFGDELSKHQCDTLLQQLSSCMFPFQCAHGRPSVVPLIYL